MSELGPHFACGSASPQCKCNCDASRGPKTFDHICEHVWDGEGIETHWPGGGVGWSATCSRCGMDAMHHDLMSGF